MRPNLIFTKSIEWNHGSNYKKIKILGSIKGYTEEIHNQRPFCIRHRTIKTQLAEIKGEIKELWKFDGQLGIKLHKFETKDQDVEI